MITLEQVQFFAKGIDPERWEEWLNLYNASLSELLEAGADELDAERSAVLKTNALIKAESTPDVFEFSEKQEITLAEVFPENPADPYQKVLPIGLYYNGWYGALVFTSNFLQTMHDNIKYLGNTVPFLDKDHDRAEAMGWFLDGQVRDDGYYVKWDFTEEGRKMIASKLYRYFSASIYQIKDPETGADIWPVFVGAALTNSPAMKSMNPAHLSDKGAKDDPIKINEGGNQVNFTEIKKEVLVLSDAEKKELSTLLGVDKEIAVLEKANTDLSDRLQKAENQLADAKKAEHEAKIETILSDAINDGRILPKDKAEWAKNLSDAFEVSKRILESMPKQVDFSTSGVSDSPEGYILSDEEKRIAKRMGWSSEEALDAFAPKSEEV